MDDIKHIHFIGIGGIGMSALARLFLHDGKTVSGSDRAASAITDALVHEGVQFFPTQEASNISTRQDLDLIVYTEAMAHDHPEMVAARDLGVPMVNYFEALGMVANEYYLIAVAGSHGKSTTTSMVADVLEEAGLDPTVIVGTLRSKTKSNYRAGKSKYAVVEACEYKRDFLHLKPEVLVITNIDYEHVDYYTDLADVQRAFATLAQSVPEGGAIITNITDLNIAPVLTGVSATVIDYRPLIDLTITLRQPGMHNRMNAAAARGVGEFLKIEPATINDALENFAGTWRRFEYKGDVRNTPVYDDYAHHPTEVRASLAGARELYPDRKVIVVTQTHTYSRTAELFADFVSAYAAADQVYLLPIYGAREENVSGVTSEQLAEAITEKGTPAVVMQTAAGIAQTVRESLNESEPAVILIMGAGDVTQVAGELTK
ncbi:UDP-N-acetylmuramate--L-alanine ligase [Patescibacteria group bacterium]|nr:UDP-N-acetylmuramate--L-alanine ligase [Patescibacteria group bacterium]